MEPGLCITASLPHLYAGPRVWQKGGLTGALPFWLNELLKNPLTFTMQLLARQSVGYHSYFDRQYLIKAR